MWGYCVFATAASHQLRKQAKFTPGHGRCPGLSPRVDRSPSEVMGSGFPRLPDAHTDPFSVSLQTWSHSALSLLTVLMTLGGTV